MTVEELYNSIGGNYDSAKRILQMDRLITKFIAKFPDDPSFGRLIAAWESRDETGIFESAHALKGVCANLGLDTLSATASALCEEFRPGNARTMDEQELERRFDELKALHDRAVAGIRAFTA